MKVFLSLLAVTTAASAGAAAAQNLRASSSTTTKNKCYTNTDEIYEALKDDSLVDTPKTFVVCPNTTIDLGYLVPGVGIDKGQSPLIPRPNTEFLCGENGRSSNNCVLRGGDFGVIMVPVFFRQDVKVDNVTISGFTFRDQRQYGVFAATEGSLTINDCIFEDSANFGTMVFNYDSTLQIGNETELGREEDEDTPPQLLDVTIKDCVFKNLTSFEMKLGVEPGIITIKGTDHTVHMENNLFVNNHFANETNADIGYAVLSQNATMKLQSNCFISNEFRGNGPILLDHDKDNNSPSEKQPPQYVGHNNYATAQQGGGDVDCELGALMETTQKERDYGYNHMKRWVWETKRQDQYVCLPTEARECPIPGYQMHLIATTTAAGEEMGQAME